VIYSPQTVVQGLKDLLSADGRARVMFFNRVKVPQMFPSPLRRVCAPTITYTTTAIVRIRVQIKNSWAITQKWATDPCSFLRALFGGCFFAPQFFEFLAREFCPCAGHDCPCTTVDNLSYGINQKYFVIVFMYLFIL